MLSNVDIPQYQWVMNGKKRKFVEYRIDFWLCEGATYVQRFARYSTLHAFHSKIRAAYKKVPEFPPKKIRNNDSAFLKIRQKELSRYLQSLLEYPELSSSLLNYFKIQGSCRRKGEKLQNPILGFRGNHHFEAGHKNSSLPNVAILGVLESFYGDYFH